MLLTLVPITRGVVVGGSFDKKLKVQSEAYPQRVIAERTAPVCKLIVGELEPTQEIVQIE